MEEPYYIPFTLQDLSERVKDAICTNEELDGTELIVGAQFVHENNMNVPPGSLVLSLQKSEVTEDEDRFGSLILMPMKVRALM